MDSNNRYGMPGFAGVGSRREVASFDTYAEAERAVDRLSDEGFPVKRVSIVAEGLEMVEQVTGRVGYGKAALAGAGQGLFVGLLFSLLFLMFSVVDPLVPVLTIVLYAVVGGAVIGALFGLLFRTLSGGRRDFSSVSGFAAERYSVMVDEGVAGEAARIVGAADPALG